MCLNSSQERINVFFNRTLEQSSLLTTYLETRPNKILVLLGPRNCGKSVLLQHVTAKLSESGARVSYLDARQVDVQTPARMAE